MKKTVLLLLTISAVAICLCACGGNYNRFDVRKYLRERGIKDCSISFNTVDLGHNEKYWKVYDKKNDVEFNVIQDVTGSPFATVRLIDNYDAMLAERYKDEMPEHDGIEIVLHEMWKETAYFEFEYTNLNELEEKYKLIEKCSEYLSEIKSDVKISITANLATPRIKKYKKDGIGGILKYTDISPQSTYSDIKSGKTLDYIKKWYFKLGYKYRFPEIEKEMSEDDIREFFSETEVNCAMVYHSGDPEDQDNKDYVIYDKIYFDGYITFGNLYYLLKEEGFEVEGTLEDFTVQSLDGKSCHFSYEYAGSGEYGTYYLVDDEEVSCECNYFKLYKKTIYDLFGLTVEEYKE